MKNFANLSKALFALFVLLALPISDAMSQEFIMQTGTATYNATCGGVIKMKAVNGKFTNNGGNNLGTVSATNAIDGIVDWAGPAGQPVQGLWYEKMVISTATDKTIEDGVYITGEACPTPTNGYDFTTYSFYIANTGAENAFSGTFNYVGTGTQTVFPGTGDDSYNNIAFGTGDYVVPAGTTTIEGTIELDPAGTLAVNGTFESGAASSLAGNVTVAAGGDFNIGTGLITFDGTLNLTGDGTVNGGAGGLTANNDVVLNGTGSAINVGAGNLTFNDVLTLTEGTLAAADNVTGEVNLGAASVTTIGTNGDLSFGENTQLNITGAITNNGDGTNLLFACSSEVLYNSTTAGQLIMPTLDTHPYGILTLSGADKIGDAAANYADNIAICGNFSLAGGNLQMMTNGGYVHMLTPASTATYADLFEVNGGFRRKLTTAGAGDYTFNNSGTILTLGGAPASGDYYQMTIQKATNPNDYDNTTDVNRKITVDYDLAGITYALQAAYLDSDLGTVTEADLKFFEANTIPESEKIAGTGYTRTNATGSTFGLLKMSGMVDGTTEVDEIIDKYIKSGNDLVLRANNKLYSIVDGRWSNPNVWDEGRTPVATDNVELRSMVYVGINGPFAGTTGLVDQTNDIDSLQNMRPENTLYTGGVAAANEIVIADVAGSALVMGNEDNGGTYVHKTNKTGTSFFNDNTNAPTPSFPLSVAKNTITGTHGFNGLWLTSYVTGNTPGIPVLGVAQIQNSGTINNEGVIEVGN